MTTEASSLRSDRKQPVYQRLRSFDGRGRSHGTKGWACRNVNWRGVHDPGVLLCARAVAIRAMAVVPRHRVRPTKATHGREASMPIAKSERPIAAQGGELAWHVGGTQLVAGGQGVRLDGLPVRRRAAPHQDDARLAAWADRFELLAVHARILISSHGRADPYVSAGFEPPAWRASVDRSVAG